MLQSLWPDEPSSMPSQWLAKHWQHPDVRVALLRPVRHFAPSFRPAPSFRLQVAPSFRLAALACVLVYLFFKTRKSESLKARAAPRAERHWQPRRLCTPGAAVTVGGPAGPIGRLGL